MKENDRRTTMQWSRNIKPISYPKSKTNEEINSVNECRWQMIQNKKIRNAIAMLKMIVQAEEEIERGVATRGCVCAIADKSKPINRCTS